MDLWDLAAHEGKERFIGEDAQNDSEKCTFQSDRHLRDRRDPDFCHRVRDEASAGSEHVYRRTRAGECSGGHDRSGNLPGENEDLGAVYDPAAVPGEFCPPASDPGGDAAGICGPSGPVYDQDHDAYRRSGSGWSERGSLCPAV